MPGFWQWLGNVANLIQILSAIPLLLTAWWFFVRARRYRRRIAEMEKTLTPHPMALAIGVAGTDITGQVKQFLEKAGMNMTVHTYTKPGGVTQKNIHNMLNDILRIKSRMTEEGATEVHLFLASPLVLAVAVGAILDNWVPVKVYHLNRETGTYEFWTPLYKGFIPGLETSALKEILGEESV
jgi:hypothetical protein